MKSEFKMTLADGRVVDVGCTSEVTYGCDCSGELHDHIEAHEIDSVTDAYSGFDLQLDDSVRDEIEKYADLFVYDVIERQSHESDDVGFEEAV